MNSGECRAGGLRDARVRGQTIRAAGREDIFISEHQRRDRDWKRDEKADDEREEPGEFE